MTPAAAKRRPTRLGLDLHALVDALSVARRHYDISWNEVARCAGVSASTLTRMKQGRRPDVDTFCLLVRWLGSPIDEFMVRVPAGEQADG